MPAPPDYEWMRVPSTHFGISKTGEHCNYLQAIEGGIDTAHISFAHNNDLANSRALTRLDTHPLLEVDDQPWGFTYAGIRDASDDLQYVRVYQFVMPNQQMRPTILNAAAGVGGGRNKLPTVNGHLWVPIDDENVYVYNFKYSIDEAASFTREEFQRGEHLAGRGPEDYIPGTWWLKSNKSNDYRIDREVQRTQTFTGIHGVNTQDFALQSALGGGYIVDRSQEALGSTDRAIQAARRLLLEAADDVEAGRPLRGSDPDVYRHIRSSEALIPRGLPWRDATKEIVQATW
jgi:phthalate 4,5-dioxygenase